MTGADASTANVRALVEQRPSILHFAVHVVSPESHPEDAALALSLRSDRLPELLGPELVTTYRVPGTLVILSGCDSQQGKDVPGVGLRGLSRAWLMAGATGVVASAWPVPDDGGRFFKSFYIHLAARQSERISSSEIAASALADAQNEMHTDGHRHPIASWAAYSVITKE